MKSPHFPAFHLQPGPSFADERGLPILRANVKREKKARFVAVTRLVLDFRVKRHFADGHSSMKREAKMRDFAVREGGFPLITAIRRVISGVNIDDGFRQILRSPRKGPSFLGCHVPRVVVHPYRFADDVFWQLGVEMIQGVEDWIRFPPFRGGVAEELLQLGLSHQIAAVVEGERVTGA